MDNKFENIVLIDWLCFTTKDTDPAPMIRWLGLENCGFIETKGHYGYKKAFQFGGIWIMYDGSDEQGICVEMSGQGCRQYETSGIYELSWLCDYLANHSDKYHITRVDVAFDDIDHDEYGGLLDMLEIDRCAREDLYISRFRSKSGQWSGKHSDTEAPDRLALSVYFGSAQSDTRFRLYDKSLERGDLGYHWTRFEMQLRDKSALSFLLDDRKVGEKFYGLINNNLRFIVPNPTDTNRRRWESPEWWTSFLQSTLKISVYTKKDVEYNMSRLEHYVFDQAGKSIYTYIQCKGIVAFNQYLNEIMEGKVLNDNQRKLINEYATEKERKLLEYYQNQPLGSLSDHPKKGN